MRRTIAYVLVLVLSMGLMLSGCGSAKAPAAPAADTKAADAKPADTKAEVPAKAEVKGKTLAFVMGVAGDAFYVSMRRGLESKVAELFKDGTKVLTQGATEWDYTKQTPIIESMIAKKVDMLITAPNNDETMIAPLKKCSEAGIPVMTVDTNIKDESFIIANITSDNLQGGKVAADILAKLIGNKGEVAVINTKPGITTTDARQKGFEDGLKAYPDVKLVSKQYCNDQAEKAAAQIQEIMLSHPKLAGAFGTNLFAATGIANGIKAKGVKIPIMCYDAGPAQIEALKKGEIDATVVQKPMAIGETAAEYAYYYFNGQKDKIVKNKLIESVVATKENMNDPEISKWFYTND